jgi:parallel beta-helix repeat protein
MFCREGKVLFKRLVPELLLVLLLTGLLTLTLNIGTVKSTWTGTVYIRTDGRVDPPDAPITTSDRITYKLVDYITSSGDGIIIERDNIILEGDGYGVQGAETYESKGIILSNRANITIRNIYIFKFYYGATLYKSSNNMISASWIIENKWYGIYLEGSNNNCIFRNSIIDNDYGVYLSLSSSCNNISGNLIESNFYGILLQPNSNCNTIYGNTITNNNCGIEICSSYNFISENEITANAYDGICFNCPDTNYNNIVRNCITQNGYGIHFIYSSSHNVILGNNITANTNFGIVLYGGKNNSIIENVVVNDYFGVYGIMDYGEIVGNSLMNNHVGVYLISSSSNTVLGNDIKANVEGICLSSANFNEVIENDVVNNDHSVTLYQSSNNRFYHNNFIENSKQVVSDSFINIWDNDYPSGGNYWSDYTGVDIYSGPFQNETGSDGIGDTPYIIDENNIDKYPLMKLYAPPPKTFTLIISATVGGTTDPPPGPYTYTDGTLVQVKAYPATNYCFDYWIFDGVNVGSSNPIEVLMDTNHTLQAVFSIITYDLTITSTTGGTTDPPAGTYTFTNGTVICVRAIPDFNYRFERWILDGEDVGSENPISILMNTNHNLEAVFTAIIYQLEILPASGGTTNPPPGTYTYINGTEVLISAIPEEHHILNYWLLNGNNVGLENPIKVLMTDNFTLQPFFTLRNYTLTISATSGGTTEPPPNTYSYTANSFVTVTAIPFKGFSFYYWLLDGEMKIENPITITMDGNHTLKAFFTDNIPPEIGEPVQNPQPNNVQPHQEVTITVNVIDYGTGIQNVTLWYSTDNGTTWMPLNITEILADTFQTTIPGFENCTWVTYKIIAYDNAGNNATKDNNGYGYQYHVIPEFSFTSILILLMLTTLIATALWKTKRKHQTP